MKQAEYEPGQLHRFVTETKVGRGVGALAVATGAGLIEAAASHNIASAFTAVAVFGGSFILLTRSKRGIGDESPEEKKARHRNTLLSLVGMIAGYAVGSGIGSVSSGGNTYGTMLGGIAGGFAGYGLTRSKNA